MSRLLFIVGRNEGQLFEELRQSFAGLPGVEVVLDRRQSERRRAAHGGQGEQLRHDRRAASYLDTHLATMGWVVVHRA